MGDQPFAESATNEYDIGANLSEPHMVLQTPCGLFIYIIYVCMARPSFRKLFWFESSDFSEISSFCNS